MWRGLGGGFSVARQPDARRALRKRNQMLAADDFFNIFQPLLVVGQNGVAHDLVFL